MQEAECAERLQQWVEALTDDQVIFRSDNPAIDWPWVQDLFQFFGCWPKNLRRRPGTIYFEEESQQNLYQAALEKYWHEHGDKQHHALVDAKSMYFAWRYAQAN